MVLIRFSAATCIMNDDLESAEEGLNHGNSSFHKVRMDNCLSLPAIMG